MSLLGSTIVNSLVNTNDVHEAPDFDEYVEMIQGAAEDVESRHFLRVAHFVCMRRVYERIARFLDLSAELVGTMGQPAVVDPILHEVEDALGNTMIRVFHCFFKSPGPPYRPELLNTWAFADYLHQTNQWSGPESSW